MADAAGPKDFSVWEAFPKGVILAWYGPGGLPKEFEGKWAFCDGNSGRPKLTDGRFLRGTDSFNQEESKNYNGKLKHVHKVYADGGRDGRGWRIEESPTSLGDASPEEHTPLCLDVRFIIKI